MAKAKEAVVVIQRPNIQTIMVTIEGTSPLIVHRFAEKAKRQILEKQMKKAKAKREARNPEEEFEAAKYKLADGTDGFPALALKQALVGSARFVEGVPMTVLRGTLFVVPDDTETGLMKINYKKCEMVQDIVRLGGVGAPADLRFRPYYYGWSINVQLKFDADALSQEQVLNLLSRAGLSQGLGEWRPERNGQNGQFEVKSK